MAKIADILRIEYMSTEESEVDEECVKHYKVQKLSRESRELKRAKRKLDKLNVSFPDSKGNHPPNQSQPTAQIGHVLCLRIQQMLLDQGTIMPQQWI
jgi:hypothetical protein